MKSFLFTSRLDSVDRCEPFLFLYVFYFLRITYRFWTLLGSQGAVELEQIKPVESDVHALAKILTGSAQVQLIGKLAAVDVIININYEPIRIANRNI